MKWPNLFIIGAPKCGTTTLAFWMKQHPQVFVPNVKEPNFFNHDHAARQRVSQASYLRLYSKTPRNASYAVDASVWYLYSNIAVKSILEFNPDSRFLVCLRNPVEMAVSLYVQLLESLQEDAPDFETAWRLQQKRQRNECLPSTCEHPERLQYGSICSLGTQLDRLYKQVANDRIHTILLDDLAGRPATEWTRLCSFLQIDDVPPKEWRVANPASMPRFRLVSLIIKAGGKAKRRLGIWHSFGAKRLNTRRIEKPSITPELRAELEEYFEGEIVKIEKRLSRSLDSWRTTRTEQRTEP